MAKHYIDFDSSTGIGHWVDTDEETGISTFGVDQYVDDILEANKYEFNQHTDNRWRGDWHKVGSIPMTLYMQWLKEGIIDDPDALKKRFNDLDYSLLRTKPGKL